MCFYKLLEDLAMIKIYLKCAYSVMFTCLLAQAHEWLDTKSFQSTHVALQQQLQHGVFPLTKFRTSKSAAHTSYFMNVNTGNNKWQ